MISLPVNNVAGVALSSAKQVLAEVKCIYLAWFSMLHLNLLRDTKGVLAALGVGDGTKITSTDLSYWELICSEFSNILEPPGTPPERATEFKIDLLPDSVLPAKR